MPRVSILFLGNLSLLSPSVYFIFVLKLSLPFPYSDYKFIFITLSQDIFVIFWTIEA